MNKILLIVSTIIFVVGVGIVVTLQMMKQTPNVVSNFGECVAEGNAVMESYPRQCTSKDGKLFTENIGNELNKSDLIRVVSPRPNETIRSPLKIAGEARGIWFFEASFPVFLTDWDGKIIAEGFATAKGDWMTTEFVPFEAALAFTPEANIYSNRGTLILKKDNPSGLPQNDDALEIPVTISGNNSGANNNSGVKGTVSLGPICPVIQNPPDPQCSDKPYQTLISVFRSNNTSNVFATTESKADGTFEISLPPGDYVLDAKGGTTLPRCSQISVNVGPSRYTEALISCDTGIR